MDELGGLLELSRVAAAGRYDTVVVDTAPTGHTLRLLAVPETLRRIAAVLDEMQAKHRFLLTRLSGRDRSDAADRLVGEIDAEAGRLASLLRDRDRCRFRWVVLPEMLAVEEARDAVRGWSGTASRSTRSSSTGWPRRRMARARSTAGESSPSARRSPAVRAAFPGRPVRLLPEQIAEPRGPAALQPRSGGSEPLPRP